MRQCKKCGVHKEFSEFYVSKYKSRKPDGGILTALAGTCKTCAIKRACERQREKWDEIKVKRLAAGYQRVKTDPYHAVRLKKGREFINSLKDKPCADCGGKFPPVCMDFDHLDPKTKKFAITNATSLSRKKILEEVAKCELVCANCHRLRTSKLLEWNNPDADPLDPARGPK